MGSPEHLITGQFKYSDESLAPVLDYDPGTVGRLDLRTGKFSGSILYVENEWELGLSPRVPYDLAIKVGASGGEFDLGGLRIQSLGFACGAGDMELRFNEPNSEPMTRLEISSGVSRLEATGLANANFGKMEFNGGVGSSMLDFSGQLLRGGKVEVIVGVGSLTIVVPRETSMSIRVRGGFLTDFDAEEFEREGDLYFSPGYDAWKPTLKVKVDAGVSTIEVKVRD